MMTTVPKKVFKVEVDVSVRMFLFFEAESLDDAERAFRAEYGYGNEVEQRKLCSQIDFDRDIVSFDFACIYPVNLRGT